MEEMKWDPDWVRTLGRPVHEQEEFLVELIRLGKQGWHIDKVERTGDQYKAVLVGERKA